MSYRSRPVPHHGAPTGGRYTARARAAAAQVRKRAERGEPCWFWGRDPDCPQPGFDFTLHWQHRLAYTVHHLVRLMDGGVPDPDPALMAPAHRGCNSRDGLRALNARRAGLSTHTVIPVAGQDHHSREW